MKHYRIYLLRPDGRIFKAKDVECQSDDEAVALAAGLREDAYAAEVWQLSRMVGYVPGSLHSYGSRLAA